MSSQQIPAYVHDQDSTHASLLKVILEKRPWLENLNNGEDERALFQWCDYEEINWGKVLKGQLRANSYCIRKGIIRKAQFAVLVERYKSKYPKRPLSLHSLDSYAVELHHPDDIDEALCELPSEVVINDNKQPWILKLSVVEKAADALIFTNIDELTKTLESLSEYIREFVVQKYVDKPLLVYNRKFSMRVYVLCVGDLEVFLFNDIFCFLCAIPYNSEYNNKYQQITNFNVNRNHKDWTEDKCSYLLDELVTDLGNEQVETIKEQVKSVCADLFSCAHAEPSVFFPLPGCFELYGIDFVVDEKCNVKILEINAGPALNHVGKRLFHKGIQLYDDIFTMCIDPFYSNNKDNTEEYNEEEVKISSYDDKIKPYGGFNTLIYSKRTQYRYESTSNLNYTGESSDNDEDNNNSSSSSSSDSESSDSDE